MATTIGEPRPAASAGALTGGIVFGGEYCPEQWPEDVWDEDVRLMREAGVTMVTVGVFAWSRLEPAPGRYEFDWLDRCLGLLHDAGIRVCLATPTAAPPPWLAHRHPETLPVTRDGVRLGVGAREAFCPSSPEYRAAATRIAGELAARYGSHEAVAMWHVGNEHGAHVAACYCDTSAVSFRDWLRNRYGGLESLNEAWGTTFWSNGYGDWQEVDVPRLAPMPVNPAQQLDFRRFSSAEFLACYTMERDALRRATDRPITTNFMTTSCKNLDYWRWADEVDVVATNHYLQAEDPDNHVDLAMTADLTRSLGGGRPWLLMEHSTGAVNWQPRNLAKSPGEMRRNSLTHLARGGDGVMFFQWRASRFGGEKFHSAMLPHGGTATKKWREVAELGADIGALDEVRGSRVHARVAVVWDWESWWALELEYRPTADLRYGERVRAYYRALWDAHVTVDFVRPTGDLGGYDVVIVPSLYLTTGTAAANFRSYFERGGHLLVSFFSGIVDEHDTVHEGALPGALRDVLGLHVDEFHPLADDQTVRLSDGSTADMWSEDVEPGAAETVLRFSDGPDAGRPAVTRNALGRGVAWYVATRLSPAGTAALVDQVLAGAGVDAAATPAGVEVVRRESDEHSYLFAVNHTDTAATVDARGHDLLTGTAYDGKAEVPASGVIVVRQTATTFRAP